MTKQNSDYPGHIRDIAFDRALGDRYLAYALSTILSRSLPDVRDGMKPVNRRLLYAMHLLKLAPQGAPKKSARIVGDVMGKFHPHGDAAIYDTLVRLAQDFTLRYPLIDGQGNFGNIDGDTAASMRYTEAKLTEVAQTLLEGIHEETVAFKSTYDDNGEEPVVFPAQFPNLLANGAIGIAVGMATSIPPHNMEELFDALKHLIQSPNATVEDLVGFIPGPDFPTGGILLDSKETFVKAYETGRGSFRLRAKYQVEELKNGTYQLIVTEIPYHVQKSKLIEKIADLLFEKKLPLLLDIRDESTEEIRVVLIPKSRSIDPHMLMRSLFKQTDLEVRIPLNLNVVNHQGVPGVLNLKEALQAFLDHRYDVTQRGIAFRLAYLRQRLEILAGYLLVFLNLDEVIRIIRFEDHPKDVLMTRFGLSDTQTESILNIRLRALQKLEELALRKEVEELQGEEKDLQDMQQDPKKCWKKIGQGFDALKKKFGKQTVLGARRTDFQEVVEEDYVPLEAYIEREPLTIICSEKGWIRTLKGHGETTDDIKYKESDKERFLLKGETVDQLLIFVSSGRCYTLAADQLPKGRGFGEPLSLLLDMNQDDEIIALFVAPKGSTDKILVVASDGRGFITPLADVIAQTKNGKQVLNISGAVRAKIAKIVSGDHVAVIGQNRRLLIFPTALLPEMGRGRGVMLQKYNSAFLSDLLFLNASDGLTWTKGSKTYKEPSWRDWLGNRGAAGRFAPTGFPKSNKFS